MVKEVGFSGEGCAITTTSASMMTDIIKGKTVDEVKALARDFHGVVSSSPTESAKCPSELGKLTVLAGVREFPARVNCATQLGERFLPHSIVSMKLSLQNIEIVMQYQE